MSIKDKLTSTIAIKDVVVITLFIVCTASLYFNMYEKINVILVKVAASEERSDARVVKVMALVKDIEQKRVADEVKLVAVTTESIAKLDAQIKDIELIMVSQVPK